MSIETKNTINEIIIMIRLNLYNHGLFCGGKVIRSEMKAMDINPLPSVSKINRILKNNYLTHGRTGYYPEDYEV